MDSSSKLADRLRNILNPAGALCAPSQAPRASDSDLERILGGRWQQQSNGAVSSSNGGPGRRRGARHGGELALRLGVAAAEALLSPAARQRVRRSCSSIRNHRPERRRRHVCLSRRLRLVRRGRLHHAACAAPICRRGGAAPRGDGRAGARWSIVSFNGKSFDAPVLETRTVPSPRLGGGGLPHVDVLHPARRFWEMAASARAMSTRPFARFARASGARRRARRDMARVRDSRALFSVRALRRRAAACRLLEHNRLDLLSLAGVTARLVHLVDRALRNACDAREALALGHV